MKVWVVVDEVKYEGGDPIAVFSTEARADEFIAGLGTKLASYRSLHKFEFELDVGTRPYWAEVG